MKLVNSKNPVTPHFFETQALKVRGQVIYFHLLIFKKVTKNKTPVPIIFCIFPPLNHTFPPPDSAVIAGKTGGCPGSARRF
jgi:hypothetical protein